VNGNGHRSHGPVGQSHARRRALTRLYLFGGAIVVVVLLAAFYYAVFGGVHLGGGWVTVGPLSDMKHQGVAFDRTVNVFVVADTETLIAFVAESPHLGERVYYCPSSGWFQSPGDGSRFDHSGFYRLGPAPRGLDRVGVRIEHGLVSVNRSQRAPGPARGLIDGGQPVGPSCLDVPGDAQNGRIETVVAPTAGS
jgi:hypothetical protein